MTRIKRFHVLIMLSAVLCIFCLLATVIGKSGTGEFKTEICMVKGNAQSIVTIIQDDGYLEATKQGYNVYFRESGLKGTIAMVYSRVTADNEQAWKEIVADGHFEIESHSYSHPELQYSSIHSASILTDDETKNDEIRLYQLVMSQIKLREMFTSSAASYAGTFPDQDVICYITPNNTMDDRSHDMAEKYYYAIRKGQRGYNTLNPKNGRNDGDWYNLKTFGSGDNYSSSRMLGAYIPGDDPGVKPYTAPDSLKAAAEKPCWVIEMWHSLYDEDPQSYQPVINEYARLHFAEIGKMQNDGVIWAATFGEAVKYIRERQNAVISDRKINPWKRAVSLTLDTGFLKNAGDVKYFDFPLTIKSEVPPGWENAVVIQAGNEQRVPVVTQGEESYIFYEAAPGNGDILIRQAGNALAAIMGLF